jgi:DNA primase small subunit
MGYLFISAKSPEVMLAFYRRLFPYKPFYLWLNQEQGNVVIGPDRRRYLSLHCPIAPTRLFTHREFAFTLGESTYVRYNSFNNVEDFKKEIIRANPTRFEIGPVYNARVSTISNLSLGYCIHLISPSVADLFSRETERQCSLLRSGRKNES